LSDAKPAVIDRIAIEQRERDCRIDDANERNTGPVRSELRHQSAMPEQDEKEQGRDGDAHLDHRQRPEFRGGNPHEQE
jgi:hypothetical protein